MASSSTSTTAAAAAARRVIVVTGGNRGIGKALCQQLLEKYSDVQVIMASRSKSNGMVAANDILQNVFGINNNNSNNNNDRLEVVEMDTSSDESVKMAATEIAKKYSKLYAIVNNAGIAYEHPGKDIMNTNYFGPRRVNDALSGLLQRPGGRIVNVSSASGPMWLVTVDDKDLKAKLNEAWTIPGGIPELDQMAQSITLTDKTYGISKAFLNAYTALHAKAEPDLIINAITPGFIASDLGKKLGATKPVEHGATPLLYLLMDEELAKAPTGRYYGSDCKRSPLDVYRGPGDPVYMGPDWQ